MAELAKRLISGKLPAWSSAIGLAGLAGTGAVHIFLYLQRSYRYIPTIGSLFLVTVITSALLIVALALTRNPLVGIVSGGFMISVFGGYVLAATISVAGFREVGQAGAAWLAGIAELVGALGLGLGSLILLTRDRKNSTK